jgi:hypothetical protein
VTVAIDFPNSPPPSNGDTFTAINGITYRYNNGKWKGIVNSGPADQLINGPKTIKFESNGILSTDAGNTLRLRSSGQGGATSIEYIDTTSSQNPYNAKVQAGNQFVRIHTAGDINVWSFDSNGTLTLPGTLIFPGDYYISGGEGSLAISSPEDPIVIITNAGINSKVWQFGADGSITFPDNTAQTTAYRNRPLTNLNLSGGTASTVFEIDMTYVDCGGSYLRGILAQDQYDGYDNGSTTTSFDKVLDGGQA